MNACRGLHGLPCAGYASAVTFSHVLRFPQILKASKSKRHTVKSVEASSVAACEFQNDGVLGARSIAMPDPTPDKNIADAPKVSSVMEIHGLMLSRLFLCLL